MSRFRSVVGNRRILGAQGRRRALLGGAVLCLHLGLFWMLTRAEHPAAPAAPQRVQVRLLPRAEPTAPVSTRLERSRATNPSVPRQAQRARAAERQPSPGPAQSDVSPILERQAVHSAIAASAASQPERPLDLSLPRAFILREGAASPVTGDPRARSARPTPEERMTQALGNRTGRSEDRLADGTRKIRRGGDCVLVHPSQAAQLFPFNDSAQRTPKPLEPCD